MNKKIVIVDIDGTISKVGDRLKHLKETPKNWDKFYERCGEDQPEKDIIELIQFLQMKYKIIFLSGRRESTRKTTADWIGAHVQLDDSATLYLRKNNDLRHDTEVKPDLLKESGIDICKIAFILEDRDSMVNKWREMGMRVLQVAAGDF